MNFPGDMNFPKETRNLDGWSSVVLVSSALLDNTNAGVAASQVNVRIDDTKIAGTGTFEQPNPRVTLDPADLARCIKRHGVIMSRPAQVLVTDSRFDDNCGMAMSLFEGTSPKGAPRWVIGSSMRRNALGGLLLHSREDGNGAKTSFSRVLDSNFISNGAFGIAFYNSNGEVRGTNLLLTEKERLSTSDAKEYACGLAAEGSDELVIEDSVLLGNVAWSMVLKKSNVTLRGRNEWPGAQGQLDATDLVSDDETTVDGADTAGLRLELADDSVNDLPSNGIGSDGTGVFDDSIFE